MDHKKGAKKGNFGKKNAASSSTMSLPGQKRKANSLPGRNGAAGASAAAAAATAAVTSSSMEPAAALSASAEARQLKRARKAKSDPRHVIVQKAKEIWERARDSTKAADVRKHAVSQLCQLLSGHVMELIRKHDASRIVETCLKAGSPKERSLIFAELRGQFVALSQSNYSRFVVLKMLKYGTGAEKRAIAKEFPGHIRALLKQKFSAEVVEYIYTLVADAPLRRQFVEEFYGPHFALAKLATSRTLKDVMEQVDGQQRKSILDFMKQTVSAQFEKAGASVGHSVLHRALLDYMDYARHAAVVDLVQLMAERCVEILHTKEGAQVAVRCIEFASAKTRKVIVKSFKGFVSKICQEEFGHQVMIRLLDVVDDTVLLRKQVLTELVSDLDDVLASRYGQLVLLYLCSSDRVGFTQPLRHMLRDSVPVTADGATATDPWTTVQVPVRKKQESVRRSELRPFIIVPLVKLVAQQLDPLMRDHLAGSLLKSLFRELGTNNNTSVTDDDQLLLSSVEGLPSEVRALHGRLIELATAPDGTLVENLTAGRLLKRLIKDGTLVYPENSSTSDDDESNLVPLAVALFQKLDGRMAEFAGRGCCCFVLATMLTYFKETQTHSPQSAKCLKASLTALQSFQAPPPPPPSASDDEAEGAEGAGGDEDQKMHRSNDDKGKRVLYSIIHSSAASSTGGEKRPATGPSKKQNQTPPRPGAPAHKPLKKKSKKK